MNTFSYMHPYGYFCVRKQELSVQQKEIRIQEDTGRHPPLLEHCFPLKWTNAFCRPEHLWFLLYIPYWGVFGRYIIYTYTVETIVMTLKKLINKVKMIFL